MAVALGDLPDEVGALLTRVQNDLFDVGADLCTPVVADPEYPPLRVEQAYVDELEADCDRYNARAGEAALLHPARRHAGSALLHVARTVVRRAERRRGPRIAASTARRVNPLTATYLNRLSDLLFILARVANPPIGGRRALAARRRALAGPGCKRHGRAGHGGDGHGRGHGRNGTKQYRRVRCGGRAGAVLPARRR